MLASSPGFSTKKSSDLTVSSDISSLQKPLSKSNTDPKTLQSPIDDFQQQMALLKQRAHQSFMQVIQMQQLHQQEVGQLRKDFQLKEENYQTQIKTLELRIRHLEYQNLDLQKNYRQHSYNIDEKDLSIDNIELISCKEEEKLDESSICNFNEIIGSQSYQQQINSIYSQLRKEFSTVIVQNQHLKIKIGTLMDKLVEHAFQMKREFVFLQELYSQAQKQLDENQKRNANNRIIYETLQKEAKFLGQQVNRLAGEKIKGQRKILQLQRKIKQSQVIKKKPEYFSAKKSPKQDLEMRKKESSQPDDNSLDMNDFIQQKLAKTIKDDHFIKTQVFSKKVRS